MSFRYPSAVGARFPSVVRKRTYIGESGFCPAAKWRVVVCLLLAFVFVCLLGIPAAADDDNTPVLRGLEKNIGADTSSNANPNPLIEEPVPPQAPVFSTFGANRPVPADPGVVSTRSRTLTIPLETPNPDYLSIKQTAPQYLVPVGKDRLQPIKLEASYTEPISLKSVLTVARENNLPIKIAKTDLSESKYKLIGSLGGFIPSMSMNYVPEKTVSGNTTTRSNPYFITILYPVFVGGGVVFNSLQHLHEMRAARSGVYISTNDVLLDAYIKYYDVVMNMALLDLRCKALEVARTQLSINQDLKAAGMGTEFEVMQARTLFALEKQRLVRQEVALRKAALQLSVTLNKSLLVNLTPAESEIARHALVEPTQTPEHLTSLAVQNRPELARWEELRLAAVNASRGAVSPLLPRAAFFTNNSINVGGSGSSIIIPTGGGSAAGGVTSTTSGSANSSFSGGFILNWLLEGAGVGNAGNIAAARMRARRAMLEAQQELLKVGAEVRNAYIDTRAAETELDVTSEAVMTASEQLRMSNMRLTHQLGTNLEVIQSERDYIDAVSRRIEAFIEYKKSQARLLHAIGLISVDTLTSDRAQRFDLRRVK